MEEQELETQKKEEKKTNKRMISENWKKCRYREEENEKEEQIKE